MLFLALALLATGCASNQIPDVRVCAEIPFVDAPEGACVWTVSHKQELISAKDWATERATRLSIRSEDWAKIKENWLQMCRIEGKACETQVDSIDSIIVELDTIAKTVLQPLP